MHSNPWEAACREWLKGCSNTLNGSPAECEECTNAFLKHLLKLQEEQEMVTDVDDPRFGVVPDLCPNCGEVLDSACEVKVEGNARPSSGDFTICIYCATSLRFTEDLTLRLLTPDDKPDIPPELTHYMRVIKQAKWAAKGA